MSSHRAKSKRALPSVPLERSDSVGRFETNIASSNGGLTGKSTTSKTSKYPSVSSNGSSSVPTTPDKSSMRKKTAAGDVLKLEALKNSSPVSARRRLLEERFSDSNSCSSESSSPRGSPGTSRKGSLKENLPLSNKVSQVIAEFQGDRRGSVDRKIARVLPMSPAVLAGDSSTTPYQKELDKLREHLGKRDRSCVVENHVGNGASDIKELGTPRTTNTNAFSTPYQVSVEDEERSSIAVAVRVRPLMPREKNDPKVKICMSMDNNETSITSEQGVKYDFVYDHSLWSVDPADPDYVGQEKLYQLMGQPLINSAFKGYNTCLFAYGQTGSGKSYSIMGQGDELGVLPRFCEELFERISVYTELTFSVEISYFEIYNEKIHDLLVSSKGKEDHKTPKKQLRVREHPILGPFVQDLSTYVVSSYADIESWLALGNKNRATASTGMNDKSSRSHSVFTIVMTQTQTEIFEDTEAQMTKTSKINLIDLAGSERASNVLNDEVIKLSAEVASLRLKEGGSINKSLHTLGKVISLLSDKELQNKRKLYIPYRDSVLTWLLKDSLGGNSRTTMIANVSPANSHFGETLSTLRYAQRARTIVNRAIINEDPNAKIIRELRAEIERLYGLGGRTSDDSNKALEEVTTLRAKLQETQQLLVESTRNWQEKLALSERRKLEEAENLRKAGISFKVDNKLPNLVNLNEDPQLSEMLLYILKPGTTTVGHHKREDIQLSGALVAESHCVVKYEGETVKMSPLGDGSTYVNGCLISEETVLHHGDRVVIGGDHFFRLNHPMDAKKRKEQIRKGEVQDGVQPETAGVKDFEFARNELAQVQNTRLQAELEEAREEARIQAQEEIMKHIQEEKEVAAERLLSQKTKYEQKTERLQAELDDLNVKKEEAEKSSQSAADVISELQAHKQVLEQEIMSNRKKLQMEAVAAKQALEETKLNQIRIMSELEKEKRKMQEDVEKLKEAKKHREKMREEFRASFSALGRKASNMDDPSKKELLRTTMALREANKISQHLKKNITLSRDEVVIDDKTETKIRLNDTKKGLSTLWSLEKFEARLELMREFYQQVETEGQSGDDDPFFDAEDKWDEDFKIDSPNSRRFSTLGALSLNSRKTPSGGGKNKARTAESIFAKYRSRTDSGQTSPDVFSPTSTPAGSDAGSPSPSPVPSRNLIPSIEILTTPDIPRGHPVSSLCAGVLGKTLESMKETSNPFDDPVYERVLSSAQRLKAALAVIKKHCTTNDEMDSDVMKNVQENCITTVVTIETLMSQVQLWPCRDEGTRHERFSELRAELMEIVQSLAADVTKMLSALDDMSGATSSTTDELFTQCEEGIRNVVKQTAKLAVLTMNEHADTRKTTTSSVSGDADLGHAFTSGQEQTLQSTIRRSIDSLDSLQEQVEGEVLKPEINEAEKDITEEVLKLLRMTSSFIYQGRDLQNQLQSASKYLKHDGSSRRLVYISRLVRGLDSVLELSKVLATSTPQACEEMDLDLILRYPDQISTATKAVTKDCRALIESEYCNVGKSLESDILDEQEYFEKKADDVKVAVTELKQTLERYTRLRPR